MTCRVTPPGSEGDKVMEQVRSVDPPFLEDDTSTAVGAATIQDKYLRSTLYLSAQSKAMNLRWTY